MAAESRLAALGPDEWLPTLATAVNVADSGVDDVNCHAIPPTLSTSATLNRSGIGRSSVNVKLTCDGTATENCQRALLAQVELKAGITMS